MFKNIPTATEFVDDYGYDWICHTNPESDKFYQDHNTIHYQIFNRGPEYIFDTAKENFAMYSTSMIKQNPGMVIPEHTDTYYKFKKDHGVEDDIVRWCVFLQDWQPGHYFDLDGVPLLNWKKGDYVELREGVRHRGANVGLLPKYTAQITGLKK